MVFYASIDRTESIGYEGIDLVVDFAFQSRKEGWEFVIGMSKLDDHIPSVVVEDIASYDEPLDYNPLVYREHCKRRRL